MLIEPSFNALLRQAHMTANDYFLHAVAKIDREFGDGYACDHPELVAACMRVAADDFNQSSRLKVTEYVAGEVIDAIDRLMVAVRRCGEGCGRGRQRGPFRGVATLHQGHRSKDARRIRPNHRQ